VSQWNHVEVWRAIADEQPDAPCLTQGATHLRWADFRAQFDAVGRWLHRLGLPRQATVAQYLYNCPEYLVAFAGIMAAGLVPINTNYRYGPEELVYLFDNADVEVLIAHGIFLPMVDEIRGRLPRLAHVIWVDDGTHPCPSWATPWDEVIATSTGDLPGLTPDDLFMIYTGGTTGMPKGVMWRTDDIFVLQSRSGWKHRCPDDGTTADVVRLLREAGPGYALLPAPPLMHGTGLLTAMRGLQEGGHCVLLEGRTFDASVFAQSLTEHRVDVAVLVGDPFGRPLVAELEAHPERYDVSPLRFVLSSGAMWSLEIKERLLAFAPDARLVDAFSSSEALGMGSSVTSRSTKTATAQFTLGPDVKVIDDDGLEVTPGSGVVGKVALGGRLPVGYYKDPEKSARTFPTINGARYSIPGDMATVATDGTITLLGRGSQCINTAGEKVFPEEVEETLKRHPAIADACVVGVPSERFGSAVVAAVEFTPGRQADEATLIEWVKAHLAHYKAPRLVRVVDTIGRAANGKMDYRRHTDEAAIEAAARGGL
jgi:3-oxocholest-4-en-26-oate---CoA ligase